MRKFIIKHRQKRKYIRKNNLQSSYLFTRTIAGSLPLISLGVTFFVMVVMDLNVRDHIVYTLEYVSGLSFSWDNLTRSFQSLPNAFAQPVAFVQAVLLLMLHTLQQLLQLSFQGIIQLAIALDPRQLVIVFGQGIVSFLNLLGQTAYFLLSSIVRMSELVLTTFSGLFMQVITGLQIVREGVLSLVLAITQFLTAIFVVVWNSVFAVALIIWNFIIAIVTAIDAMITAVFSTVFSIIRIPFDAAAALWEQIRPYAVILGYNMQLALEDMRRGFDSLGKVVSVVQSGLK